MDFTFYLILMLPKKSYLLSLYYSCWICVSWHIHMHMCMPFLVIGIPMFVKFGWPEVHPLLFLYCNNVMIFFIFHSVVLWPSYLFKNIVLKRFYDLSMLDCGSCKTHKMGISTLSHVQPWDCNPMSMPCHKFL